MDYLNWPWEIFPTGPEDGSAVHLVQPFTPPPSEGISGMTQTRGGFTKSEPSNTQRKPLLNSGTIWFIFRSFCFCLKLYPMRFLFPAGIRNGNSLKVIPISWVTRKCLYSLLRSWFSQDHLAFFFFLILTKAQPKISGSWEYEVWGFVPAGSLLLNNRTLKSDSL